MLSCFSCVRLFVIPWTVAHQAPLSMGFSRQEYWSGLLCPPPGDLLDPGIEPASVTPPALQADFLFSEPPGKPSGKEFTSLWVRPVGQEDPLEEGTATHSSILAWKIPWTEQPRG